MHFGVLLLTFDCLQLLVFFIQINFDDLCRKNSEVDDEAAKILNFGAFGGAATMAFGVHQLGSISKELTMQMDTSKVKSI